MRKVLLALSVALLPALVHAGEIYRWEDGGVVHYSNIADVAPVGAAVVETPITVEVARLPAATEEPLRATTTTRERTTTNGLQGYAPPTYRFRALPDAPRIYDDARMRFGCFTGGVLYYGGFSHAEDISPTMNCYPYRLGPTAWLNTARAELAMRQNGISPRDMLQLYTEP